MSADDESNELVTTILLRLHADNLPRWGIRKSYPDTYAVVTTVEGPINEGVVMRKRDMGCTEVIHKSCRPQWTRTFSLRYKFGSESYFFVRLFRKIKEDSDQGESWGDALFEIGDILGSKHHTKIKRLPKGGVIFCRLEPIHKENEHLIFRFRFSATLIAGSSNHSSFSAFANPPNSYIQISKKHENASGWVAIYRSSRVDDSSTPTWDVGEVNMASLCNGDWDRPLRLVVMQHHRKAQDVVLGECETTLRMILNTQRDTHSTRSENEVSTHGFCLQRNMSNPNPKPSGRLQVKLAQVIDTLHNNEISSTSMFSSTCSLDDASDDGTWKDHHVVNIAAIPTPITSRATFQDYIQSGWMLNPFVAIDFTSSNGDPRIPGTLHYQNPITFNDYEETIVSIGTAIAPYTEGGASVTTVWGFGSKFDGELRHIFQCGPQPRVSGVDGILDAYRSVLAAGLTMSGPTCLDKVLRAAGSTARKHQESNVRLYSVLLIITDGICQNLEETKRLLSVYHSEPLSIIIVGVGRADFGELRELESFPKVTVCEFRKHQHDPRSLGRSALERLPTQFVEYMIEKEMSP